MTYFDVADVAEPAPEPPRRRRPIGWIVAVVLLTFALGGAVWGAVTLYTQLQDARSTIDDRDREIQEQRDLIDRKEVYGAAVNDLLGEIASFQGIPLPSLVPWDDYQALTVQAWNRRWDAAGMDDSIAAMQQARDDLAATLAAAGTEAAGNASGSAYETAFDQLGHGFVTWHLDDADALCEGDVLACVTGEDPLVVHVDAKDESLPYMTDWIRTGIAYHEFAHVLQYADPAAAETASVPFGGDWETMADCFALTYLDGWSLDQRVWSGRYSYWDVSLGYGRTCTDAEREGIRQWRDSLAIAMRQLGPGLAG